MPNQIDLQKEWVKAKDNLNKFSKDLSVLARNGEREIVRLSKLGKLQVDSTAMILKKEHILHLIGKEYLRMKCPGNKSLQMKELLAELNQVNKQHRHAKMAMKAVK